MGMTTYFKYLIKPSWSETYNGYVAISPEHPLYKFGYDDECLQMLEDDLGVYLVAEETYIHDSVSVHGGLTYSEMHKLGYWVFGWDTQHFGDNLTRWPEREVERENQRLYEQLINYDLLHKKYYYSSESGTIVRRIGIKEEQEIIKDRLDLLWYRLCECIYDPQVKLIIQEFDSLL
jgi:hypothetical protein